MAKISAAKAGGKNMLAFLDLLAIAEGTSTSRHTQDDGYDVIVEGVGGEPKTFTDYSAHPNVLVLVRREVRSPVTREVVKTELKSTAAGRYQLLNRYAKAYTATLKLPDFGPLSQDLIAIRQIREQGAYDDVLAGRITLALSKVSNIWASLPGDNYGQRGAHSPQLATLLSKFTDAGGTLA
jgi:muramidase (phage lysozyme)